MRKLEILLRGVERSNYDESDLEEFRKRINDLGMWVYRLWFNGDLSRDAEEIKLAGKQYRKRFKEQP